MTKRIACGEIVEGCGFTAEAETEEELVKKVKEHAAKAHGVDHPTPELQAKVQAAIRTR
jgi:predicted small metal-binding protein